MAAAEGMPYHELITEILYLAAERFSMPFDSINELQSEPIFLQLEYQTS